jgi:RNA polymerase sigma-70 factor (ECF subfamily)
MKDGESHLTAEQLLQHAGWMKALALKLVADGSRADDAVQQTLLRAMERPRRPPRSLLPWLATVLRNFIRQSHREEHRRRRREAQAARPESISSTPEKVLERVELHAQIVGAVLKLSEPYRSTVLLHFFEEMSLGEIAREQGVPLNTVKTRLRRALDQLRVCLDRLHGGNHRAWCAILLPLLGLKAGASPTSAGAGLERWLTGARQTSNVLSSLTGKGIIMGISSKSIAAAATLSLVLLGVGSGYLALHRRSPREDSETRSYPLAGAAMDPSSAGIRSLPEPSPAIDRNQSPAGDELKTSTISSEEPASGPDRLEDPADPGGDLNDGKMAGASVALGEKALEARKRYLDLKELFGDGGQGGWKRVREKIASIRAMFESDEGMAEVLELFDQEKDGSFLEAVLHHLGTSGEERESQQKILANEALQDEIWTRFEQEKEPSKRMAYLTFFCYRPELTGKKMDSFLQIASSDPSPVVRSKSIDALTSARDLLSETWPVLCDIAESDGDESCRAGAIDGLARVHSDRAMAIVRAAFSSSSETLKAAALESEAGASPPVEVTGGDVVSYLVREFRAARTREYKTAVTRRLLKASPEALKEEITRALSLEKDARIKMDYRKALERVEEGLPRDS